MKDERLSHLLNAYVDGMLTPSEKAELEQTLLSSPALRAQFWSETRIHDQLRVLASETGPRATTAVKAPAIEAPFQSAGAKRRGELLRRPFAAAAAGIMISAVCTSAVWAYAGQWRAPKARIHSIPIANFESVASVPPDGIPSTPNQWGGDFTRIVGAENGVQPRSGLKMLRFLRADNALTQTEERNYVGEAAYVVDLRPLRAELQAGVSQMEITAWFAAAEEKSDDRQFRFLLKAAAFNGDPAEAPRLWEDFGHASLSMVQRQIPPASTPQHWQPLTISIPVPPEADMLVFECGVLQCHPYLKNGTAEFPGHYVTDVSVQLRTPATPVPLQAGSKETP